MKIGSRSLVRRNLTKKDAGEGLRLKEEKNGTKKLAQ